MTIIFNRICSRFGHSLLWSLCLLLGSCRSERLAFEFQPTAVDKAIGSEIALPQNRIIPATILPASMALVTPIALPRHQTRTGSLPSRHKRQRLLPAITQRVMRNHKISVMPQATRGSLSRRSPHKVASAYEGMFYTGLISVGLGLLCLITSLILLSGLLALTGLGLLLLGLVLTAYGWHGDGHWDFG